MNMYKRIVALTLAGWIVVGSNAHAQTPSPSTGRATLTWTIGGAGAGFGVGLWAGLSAFDDAINSERKIWTSAVVGATVGAVGGYLVGKARARGSKSSAGRSVTGWSKIEARAFSDCDRVLPRARSLTQLIVHSNQFRCTLQGP